MDEEHTSESQPVTDADTSSGWPPPTPPEPPLASSGRGFATHHRTESLTDVEWGLGAATLFVLAMVAATVAAAFAAAVLRRLSLDDAALTLSLSALLSGAYLVVLCGGWLAARAVGVGFAPAFGIRPASVGAIAGGAVIATVAGRLAAGVWAVIIQHYGWKIAGSDVDPSTLFPPGALGIAMTLLLAGIIAPIAEEIVFRGVLLSALDRRWGAWSAIIISSVVFSLMHVTLFAIPPIFVFALVLGWYSCAHVRSRCASWLTLCSTSPGSSRSTR